MTGEAPCGPAKVRRRARMARTYLGVAEQTALAETDEGRNVAAGNAVSAAIAAADGTAPSPSGASPRRPLRRLQHLVLSPQREARNLFVCRRLLRSMLRVQ